MALHVLLCEPYFTGSHAAWATGYAAASRHRVSVVAHAGGFWKWRMQGGALTLAADAEKVTAEEGKPDVVVLSDMVHVPAFLGFARRWLGDVPAVVYQHENQLTYPLPRGVERDLTYALTNWMGMAAADLVIFNSDYHRRSFFDALPGLLRRFPDYRHSGFIDDVRGRSAVLPVGVDLSQLSPASRSGEGDEPPVILWNQRWEYDKGPKAFAAALEHVSDLRFRLVLAGQTYFRRPAEMEHIVDRFGDRLIHAGTASEPHYRELLLGSDIVVSTALHEYFGVAVVEAVAAGAMPVLPARLSYPELLPAAVHDDCLYPDGGGLVARLRRALTDPEHRRSVASQTSEWVTRFAWESVAPAYDAALERLVRAGSRT